MFTGIVEETGGVESFVKAAGSWRLVVSAKATLQGLCEGESIAVNGCFTFTTLPCAS